MNSRKRNGINFLSEEAKDITYLNRFLFTELTELGQSADSATSMCASVSRIAICESVCMECVSVVGARERKQCVHLHGTGRIVP